MDRHTGREPSSSSLSTLTTLSEDFSSQVKDNMKNTAITTNQCVRSANKHLEKMAQDPRRRVNSSLYDHDVDPHLILAAMLKHAPEGGRRYVACAILTCQGEVAIQVDLANTWLYYLLFPVKGYSDQRGTYNATDEATPSLEETQRALTSLPKTRSKDFKIETMHRDGFQCVITKAYDRACRLELHPRGEIQAAHIVKHSLAVFNDNKDEVIAACATWEIIRQYTGWSVEKMEDMIDDTDTPANGFMLEIAFHLSWDRLDWTLVPKEVEGQVIPNTYLVQVLNPENFPTVVSHQDTVTFKDYSVTDEEHMNERHREEYPKPPLGVPLPNPEFIGFHCVIANVLHMSGAAQIIDLAMDQLQRAGFLVKAMGAEDLMLQLSSLQLMDCMYQDRSLL